jgi:adenine-specific DNA-methyltransferase
MGTNANTAGRYHTNWLNMMYPRLKLARNLLRDDGVIFISIDDNEQANLKKLCDEIFGEENLIIQICHKSRASVSNDKIISTNHNIILAYAKNERIVFENRSDFGLDPNLDDFKYSDKKGEYKLVPVDGPGGAKKGNPYYTFEGITGYWRFSEDTMREKFDKGVVVKVGNNLQQKYYKQDAMQSRKTTTSWWDEKFYTSEATKKLNKLMGDNYFDTPKPIELIEKMLKLCVRSDNDIVLDFFAGSATTAHAVMQFSLNDGIKRRHISVQLPETTDKKSETFKAGYKNIAEISKERIRRAGKKIQEENPDYQGDTGFKVFKLDSSNIKHWEPDFDTLETDLYSAMDYIKKDRSTEDVLYEILLKYGLDLTVPIEKRTIAEKTVYSIGLGALVVCLEQSITMELVNGIGALKEELQPEIMRVVFKDDGFKDDVVKTNALQTLKRLGIEDIKSL